jgi:hypothetical protein
MILVGFFTSTTIVPAATTDVLLLLLATDKNANQSSILKHEDTWQMMISARLLLKNLAWILI